MTVREVHRLVARYLKTLGFDDSFFFVTIPSDGGFPEETWRGFTEPELARFLSFIAVAHAGRGYLTAPEVHELGDPS